MTNSRFADMRLTRQQSMTRGYEFARVRGAGVAQAGRFLVVSVVALEDTQAGSKFGVICTKKIGCAVVRNKMRRRVKEVLRKAGDDFTMGYMMVCVVRWRAVNASFAELASDWKRAAKKMKHQLNGTKKLSD